MTTEARLTSEESKSTGEYVVQSETTKSIGRTEGKEMTDVLDTTTMEILKETGNGNLINKKSKYSPKLLRNHLLR